MASNTTVWARPDQSLSAHLEGVKSKATSLVSDEQVLPTGDLASNVVSTVAQLHDSGKLTTWFQAYLARSDSKPKARERHALVSAYITFHALLAEDVERETAVAGFYAVAKHHSVIPNIREEHSRYTDIERSRDRLERVAAQIENIDENEPDLASALIKSATDGKLSWDAIVDTDVHAYAKTLDASWAPSDHFYPSVLRLWSILTCADKMDAAGIDVTEHVSRPDPEQISFTNEAEGITKTLNEKRTQARRTAVTRGQKLAAEGNQVFTLTLPTGFGKTFAGLETALRIAENDGGKVVYALPYTTVIDQIHDEIIDRFDVQPDGEQYTIHHHLADTRTQINDESVSDGTEMLYGQTWQSGLVLTTFVQLFESLAGPGNTQSIKLPALEDAVIIVDEPQTLPRRWWYLVSRLTTILVDQYDATVIFMTATQPRLIEELNTTLDPRELINESPDEGLDEYFGFLETHERVSFELHDSVLKSIRDEEKSTTLDHTMAGRTIVSEVEDTAKNVLAVNNTVASASTLTKTVQTEIEKQIGGPLSLGSALHSFYATTDAMGNLYGALAGTTDMDSVVDSFLSFVTGSTSNPEAVIASLTAALRPCDRALLIETIRRILDSDTRSPFDDIPVVVVSTQLVEAGVDVSFDRLYRDLAPVPSLVQAAGRCNRSFSGEKGEVTIWRLGSIDGSNPPPSTIIYTQDGDRLRPTRQALGDTVDIDGRISEISMITTVNDAYYQYLHDADHKNDQTDRLATAIDDARGDDLREASLIQEYTDDAIVLLTDTDYRKLKRYLAERANGNFQSARQAFTPLKHAMATAKPAQLDMLDSTEAVVDEAVGDALSPDQIDEMQIVDARESQIYTIRGGEGLRD